MEKKKRMLLGLHSQCCFLTTEQILVNECFPPLDAGGEKMREAGEMIFNCFQLTHFTGDFPRPSSSNDKNAEQKIPKALPLSTPLLSFPLLISFFCPITTFLLLHPATLLLQINIRSSVPATVSNRGCKEQQPAVFTLALLQGV